jgi:hypothetical protein
MGKSKEITSLVNPWEQFPNAFHLYKQLYASINTMGPRSCQTAQEGDAFCPRDECTVVKKVQINSRTTAKDLVKMLEETSTKVSISTVKQVI